MIRSSIEIDEILITKMLIFSQRIDITNIEVNDKYFSDRFQTTNILVSLC